MLSLAFIFVVVVEMKFNCIDIHFILFEYLRNCKLLHTNIQFFLVRLSKPKNYDLFFFFSYDKMTKLRNYFAFDLHFFLWIDNSCFGPLNKNAKKIGIFFFLDTFEYTLPIGIVFCSGEIIDLIMVRFKNIMDEILEIIICYIQNAETKKPIKNDD